MYSIQIDANHMMSVICGVKVDQPWRSQRGVELIVPYSEWLDFMKTYGAMLKERSPYAQYYGNDDCSEEQILRSYMYHVASSLYNEIMISANNEKEATLIVPYSEEWQVIEQNDLVGLLDSVTQDDLYTAQEIFAEANPCTYHLYHGYLSSWNLSLLKLSTAILRNALSDEPILFSVNWRFAT